MSDNIVLYGQLSDQQKRELWKENPSDPKDCEPKYWWSIPKHQWGKWIVIKLLTENGKVIGAQKRICKRCGKTEREDL